MIAGVVNADHEAIIPLIVRGRRKREIRIPGIVDTGFTGSLILPSDLIGRLRLPWLGSARALLADGSPRLFDLYAVTVVWDGRARTVETGASEAEPLVGMDLMHGHELRVQVVEGGQVTINTLREAKGT